MGLCFAIDHFWHHIQNPDLLDKGQKYHQNFSKNRSMKGCHAAEFELPGHCGECSEEFHPSAGKRPRPQVFCWPLYLVFDHQKRGQRGSIGRYYIYIYIYLYCIYIYMYINMIIYVCFIFILLYPIYQYDPY